MWSDFGLRTSDYGLRTLDFGLRTSDFGLRTSDFGLRTSDFGLRTSDFGLRTSDSPFVIFKLPKFKIQNLKSKIQNLGSDTFPVFLEHPRLFSSRIVTAKESKHHSTSLIFHLIQKELRMQLSHTNFATNLPTHHNGPSKLQKFRPIYCQGDHYRYCSPQWFTSVLLLFLYF